ncbi:hypothetical protein BTUL_0053g00320 [Botrytis tulipae]|uniref:Uncharacterized protein n=1 Tax=Botrytis tulipae TaxID=87230 RepID=A0A4Z1EVA5_9HELO|nr:hypothetical protein BTUL_0053g00320 [Botrytis tulipae]
MLHYEYYHVVHDGFKAFGLITTSPSHYGLPPTFEGGDSKTSETNISLIALAFNFTVTGNLFWDTSSEMNFFSSPTESANAA